MLLSTDRRRLLRETPDAGARPVLSFPGETSRQCVLTFMSTAAASAWRSRMRCPPVGLCQKICSRQRSRAQRQMADFGCGGQQPIWPHTSELFYLDGRGDRVEIDVAGGAPPQAWALAAHERRRTEGYRGLWNAGTYSVAPDGKRFLVNQLREEPIQPQLR